MAEASGLPRAFPVQHVLGASAARPRGGAAVIGSFDGVHRGHQALLGRMARRAEAVGGPAVVLTFEPNPRTFFRPDEPVFRLTPPEARARLLAAVGVTDLVVATFDAALAGLSPEQFAESILVRELAVRAVVVGEDFRFGARRAGSAADLAALGARFGFTVDVVAPVCGADGVRFSSSAIREALAAGDIPAANARLGYRWFVQGTVIHGAKRGRELGFPTANVRLPTGCRLREGIYAVTLAAEDGIVRPAVASYGRRPQFDNGAPVLEVHVLDFRGDLYAQEVIVTFHAWIRPEARFPSVDALVTRMHEDAAEARRILAGEREGTPLDAALAGLAPQARRL